MKGLYPAGKGSKRLLLIGAGHEAKSAVLCEEGPAFGRRTGTCAAFIALPAVKMQSARTERLQRQGRGASGRFG